MDEEKLIDLETKLAHQEHLLSKLDDALSNQQAQIGKLELFCRTLAERIRALSEAGAAGGHDNEKPPHY